MAIQRISEIEGEPEIGRFYFVPCIWYFMPEDARNGWWPVLPPAHGDAGMAQELARNNVCRAIARVRFYRSLTRISPKADYQNYRGIHRETLKTLELSS
jgi:hypothetical protein